LAKQVYSLYAGENYDRDESPNANCVDTQRVNRIYDQNKSLSQYFTPNPAKLIRNNALWITPAFFNHSCVKNTIRIFFGDAMFIFALRNLSKGEELTTNYFSFNFTNSLANRQGLILLTHHFECDCELCVVEHVDPTMKQKEALFKHIEERIGFKKDPRLALSNLQKMRDLMKNRPKNLQSKLLGPLNDLADTYAWMNNWLKSAEASQEIYEVAKYSDHVSAIIALNQAADSYQNADRLDKGALCLKAGAELLGGDEALFNHISSVLMNRTL